MKFYQVAMFMFIFNLVFAFLSDPIVGIASGFEETATPAVPSNFNSEYFSSLGANNVTGTMNEAESNFFSETINFVSLGFTLIFKGSQLFIGAFWNATVGFGPWLYSITAGYLPLTFVAIFSGIVYFVYIAAILQLWLGRNFKEGA